jgi:cellobiose phosphorylase
MVKGVLIPLKRLRKNSGLVQLFTPAFDKTSLDSYVVAVDIYGQYPHIGRGGWIWYTGSASWMYRAAIESILGFEVKGNAFRVTPRVPSNWSSFSITYRHGESTYIIRDGTRRSRD